jgi:hypothetical protein
MTNWMTLTVCGQQPLYWKPPRPMEDAHTYAIPKGEAKQSKVSKQHISHCMQSCLVDHMSGMLRP